MDSILSEVVTGLDSFRGIWPRIADESGVAYSTLQKIAQGQSSNPRLRTVMALHDWLKNHGGIVEQPSPYDGPERRKQAA